MSADIGNKYAQKWDEKTAIVEFAKALNYATDNNDCLSLADAIAQTNIPYSTFDYLAEKYQVLGHIKKDAMRQVIRRINKKALEGDYNPTASIWRMKMLGEQEVTKTENKNEHSGSISIDPKKWS